MLSKSAARLFLMGTVGFSVIFLGLTWTPSAGSSPDQEHNITPQVVQGKQLWEKNNCMGCHTLLGEGAYYAPELTKVYERRGPEFIKAMLRDPQAMYPGQRRMVQYHFTDGEIEALLASAMDWRDGSQWLSPKPTLLPVAVPVASRDNVVARREQPKVFNQLCIACHSLGGRGRGRASPG